VTTAARGALGDGRPRLVVVEEIALASSSDPYLGLRALSTYSGCSVRWLRDRLTDMAHPLPCFRLPGGKILVRRSDFDGWIAAYRHHGHPDVNRIVADALKDLL